MVTGRFHKGIVPWNKGLTTKKTCTVCSVSFSGRGVKYCSLKCAGVGSRNKKVSLETRGKMSLKKIGTKQSQETILKRIQHQIGEKNWRWISDRSLIKVGDRNLHDPLVKQWRKEVKKRDNFSCRIADNNCDGKLEVHHILRWSEFPELRYQPNNGITLCHYHHPRKVVDEKRLVPTFMELVSVSSETLSLQ